MLSYEKITLSYLGLFFVHDNNVLVIPNCPINIKIVKVSKPHHFAIYFFWILNVGSEGNDDQKISVPKKTKIIEITKSIKASIAIFLSIVWLKKIISFRPHNLFQIVTKISAIVVTRIPPAVDDGAPPINIEILNTHLDHSDSARQSIEFIPRLRHSTTL